MLRQEDSTFHKMALKMAMFDLKIFPPSLWPCSKLRILALAKEKQQVVKRGITATTRQDSHQGATYQDATKRYQGHLQL